ncbi:MAG TPA: carboxymuconolactone decarboxylase family protein [Gammaproteobacteria bacterium]|nr:carboxymuconolactone decarboxylase family protein [Gammaproteobacteria bacterium]
MDIAELRSRLPDYAKDLRLNLESVLSEGGAPGLSQKQIALIALASAVASRHQPLTQAIAGFAAEHADAGELDGARAAAAIMGMNNVYYRFCHLVDDSEYGNLRASLRMNVMARPGVDKADFELASLAVSAINGCGTCMNSHEKTLRQQGLGVQAVQSAVRIAAVVHAVAVTLEQKEAVEEQAAAA